MVVGQNLVVDLFGLEHYIVVVGQNLVVGQCTLALAPFYI